MPSVVVDASIAVKWLVPEPGSDWAIQRRESWREQDLFPCAPDFLLVELHNIIWKKARRGQIQPTDPVIGLVPTFGLNLNWWPAQSLLSTAFLRAIQHDITIYDALYVALAQHLRATLCTADLVLAAKLRDAGISLDVLD